MDPATEYHTTSWHQQGQLERKMFMLVRVGI